MEIGNAANKERKVEGDNGAEEPRVRPEALKNDLALQERPEKSYDDRDNNECFADGRAIAGALNVILIHGKRIYPGMTAVHNEAQKPS